METGNKFFAASDPSASRSDAAGNDSFDLQAGNLAGDVSVLCHFQDFDQRYEDKSLGTCGGM